MPQDELLERFLIQYIDIVDEPFLRENVDQFAGLQYVETTKYNNAYASEAEKTEPIDLLGGETYIADVLALRNEIDQDYEEYLRKYNVQYIVTNSEAAWNPRVPRTSNIISQGVHITVYELNY